MGAPPLRPEQIPSAAGLGHGFPAGGLEVAQKDFGAVGSAVGTGKYGQRRPGLGGRDAPRQGAGQDPPCSGADAQACRVPTGRAVSLLRRVGPTVGPALMKQTDEGLHGDKHCSAEQQEIRAENPIQAAQRLPQALAHGIPVLEGVVTVFQRGLPQKPPRV